MPRVREQDEELLAAVTADEIARTGAAAEYVADGRERLVESEADDDWPGTAGGSAV